jgi:YggT family protein
MSVVFLIIDAVLEILIWLLIAVAVLSWFVDFNLIDARNSVVSHIQMVLRLLTEPVLRPLRMILPKLGTIDPSPVVMIVIIILVRYGLLWLQLNYFA